MAEAKPAALSHAAIPSLFVETVERARPDTGFVTALFLPAPRDREIVPA